MNLYEKVELGKLECGLAVSKGVLLVWHLRSKLSPGIFVKKLVSSRSQSSVEGIGGIGNIRQSAMRREMLQHGQANLLQGHRVMLETFCFEVLLEHRLAPIPCAPPALLDGNKGAHQYRDCRRS